MVGKWMTGVVAIVGEEVIATIVAATTTAADGVGAIIDEECITRNFHGDSR